MLLAFSFRRQRNLVSIAVSVTCTGENIQGGNWSHKEALFFPLLIRQEKEGKGEGKNANFPPSIACSEGEKEDGRRRGQNFFPSRVWLLAIPG